MDFHEFLRDVNGSNQFQYNFIVSFLVKVQGAGEDDQFVVRRQHSLQRWLRTIVKHHALTKDPDIQAFLTQDAIAPATR